MQKIWFEMNDLIRKEYDKSVWIPLNSAITLQKKGEYGKVGHIEEYFGATAIMFYEADKEKALKCQWQDIGMGHDNRPFVDDTKYLEAGYYENYEGDLKGKYLILQQYFDYTHENPEWHLSEDLILGLGLLRIKDSWISTKENYQEVIRLKRNEEGKPVLVEIRAEHLKDYLSARKAGLLLSTYHSRKEVVANNETLGWKDDYREEIKKEFFRWSGHCTAIHEGNCSPFGSKMAVLQVGRIGIDYEEDVPKFDLPEDESTWSERKTLGCKGRKLFLVAGELWKTEWISAGSCSPRVKGDRVESKIAFVIDNQGKTQYSKEFQESGIYLWFKPSIVAEILRYRSSILDWYTEDTGKLGLPGRAVHFGVNSKGLINVYAKDIALLPEYDKKIWVGHNITPEGGVSMELLQSQMEARPAETYAPEDLLVSTVEGLNWAVNKKWQHDIFVTHEKENEVRKNIHRFQALDKEGVCRLAKELTRYIIERLNIDFLRSQTPKMDPKTGSLKRLENLLKDNGLKGDKLIAPLFGIYELRKSDAHLMPNENFQEALSLIEITASEDYLKIGKTMISKVGERLYIIARLIHEKLILN